MAGRLSATAWHGAAGQADGRVPRWPFCQAPASSRSLHSSAVRVRVRVRMRVWGWCRSFGCVCASWPRGPDLQGADPLHQAGEQPRHGNQRDSREKKKNEQENRVHSVSRDSLSVPRGSCQVCASARPLRGHRAGAERVLAPRAAPGAPSPPCFSLASAPQTRPREV